MSRRKKQFVTTDIIDWKASLAKHTTSPPESLPGIDHMHPLSSANVEPSHSQRNCIYHPPPFVRSFTGTLENECQAETLGVMFKGVALSRRLLINVYRRRVYPLCLPTSVH